MMRRLATRERALADVPRPVLALLAAGLALQLLWHLLVPAQRARPQALQAPPSLAALRLASLGEPVALSKLLMFHVQSIDSSPDLQGHFQMLDYASLEQWLARISELDPRAEYPLIAASHLYAEVQDPDKTRRMLEFVYRRFLDDPNRRWRALAQVTMVAKHQLHDLPLARRYAAALRHNATAAQVPDWARQLEFFVLEDMNEIDSAAVLLDAMQQSGQLKDPAERRFLQQRLAAMRRQAGAR